MPGTKGRRPFWSVRAATIDPGVGELLLYGLIGAGGISSWFFDEVSPAQFRADLAALGDIRELRVYINSDGGDVFAAQAIYSVLHRLEVPTVAIIDGLAASSASLIAVAADTVVMPPNAMMMIHSPWLELAGNAAELRVWAERLDLVQQAMLPAYAGKSGLEEARIQEMLTAETWMTADQAVELGFADRIEETRAIAASAIRPGLWDVNGQHFDVTRFAHPPELPAARRVARHHIEAEAIPYANTGTAPESAEWSAPTLADFTSKQWADLTAAERRHVARHFVWTDDGMPPEAFSDLGGPHHRPSGTSGEVGPAVWAAVSSGRMQQASWANDAGVRRHLAGHYREFNRQPPWERAEAEDAFRHYSRSLAGRAELVKAR